MSLPPSEIPLGAMRFNSDSQKLEYYDGAQWLQVSTFSPNLNGGARGVFSMGIGPSPYGSGSNIIDYVNISSTGNAVTFGSATIQATYSSSCASSTRGIIFGGMDTAGNNRDNIQFFTISSTGNSSVFGTLSSSRRSTTAFSNSTRGIVAGGQPDTNTIEYVTISSTGSAVDFGDLTQIRSYGGGVASSTRGLVGGGRYDVPAATWFNIIDFVTIATLGQAQDFGDLTLARGEGVGGLSNSTRGVFAGGNASPALGSTSNVIDYVTIATIGNATDFGDLSSPKYSSPSGASSSTRGLFAGGNPVTNTIDYITILTQGNAVDFGDLTVPRYGTSGCSNAHGGL